MAREKIHLISLPTCLNAVQLTLKFEGQVDQLEDRYLGMVEASGSNPDLSILGIFGIYFFDQSDFYGEICQKQKVF